MMLIAAAVLGATLAASSRPQLSHVGDRAVLAATPGHTLSFTVGDHVEVGDVTDQGLSTEGLHLRRFAGRLQGQVGVEPIDVRLEPGRVEGTLGDHRVALDVWRRGDGLDVAGTFGARSVAVGVGPLGIHAQVGPCRYDLRMMLGSYRGMVVCGGPAEQVQLSVPVAFVARDDREIATMLAALLAR